MNSRGVANEPVGMMAPAKPVTADVLPAGLRSGPMMVFAAATGFALSTLHVFSFGILIEPLEQEFGWSRSAIAAGLTIVSVISVLMAPIIGYLIDRVGARRVAITGTIIYCAAFAFLSTVGPAITHWWFGWTLVAFGSVCIKPTVWSKAVASRFLTRRGIAMALALCGSGFSSMVLPRIVAGLIEGQGWRFAYAIMGGVSAVLVLPILYLCFFEARDLEVHEKQRGRPDLHLQPGLSIREGFTGRVFWQLVATALLATSAIAGMMVHFIPMMGDKGLSREAAAAIAGVIGAASMGGRIATGFLLDHVDGRVIGSISFLLPVAAGIMILGYDGSTAEAVVIALLIGLAMGAETDVIAYLGSFHFGIRHYGLLFGTVAGMISFGGGVGPFVGGMIFDHFHRYDEAIYMAIPASILSSLLMATLGRPSPRAGHVQH